jgi:simple sugar transport system ATP-binding protein
VTGLALSLVAIDKRFGEVEALSRASLAVRRGTLHAVLGENGAGKTTLMRVAFGMLRPDAGTLTIDGIPVTLRSSRDAIANGLGMVHQHFTLVPAMTVAENLALGGTGLLRLADVATRARQLAARTGLTVDPEARVETLGVGAQQRVEILKALYGNARVLILDEPTAVLSPQEADELFAWLRRFVAGGGTAVLVTHKLQEALAVADDVTVLRRGACVLSGPSGALDIDALVQAVTGSAATAELATTGSASPVRAHPPRPEEEQASASVARLDAVSVRDARGVWRLRDVGVACRAGEIVGVAGVEGSGVRELLRVLAGRLAPSEGRAVLPERVGWVPEDRQRDALIEEFTLTENVALRGAAQRRGVLDWRALSAQAAGVIARHDVRTPSPSVRAGTLSGGNQQKLVVGRELDDRPPLIVAENPVRGLDIRATAHVMRELAASAAAGSAVVIYTADVDEILPVADRMLVVFGGQVREVPVERPAVVNALVGAAR